jgi:hypothetical protein
VPLPAICNPFVVISYYVDRCCAKPPPGDAVVIELDEMWHFLRRKDNKVWIWKAYDRATGRLVDWECSGECTFRRLFERLERWKVRLFCSGSYGVYPLVLAVGNHYQGKEIPPACRSSCCVCLHVHEPSIGEIALVGPARSDGYCQRHKCGAQRGLISLLADAIGQRPF